MVDVYDTASSSRVGRVVLGGDARSHTFRSLSPGTRYSVAVRATAGPFHTSTPNLTHCTRECDALLAAWCPPPGLPLPGAARSCLPLSPGQALSAHALLDVAWGVGA